MRFFLDTEFMEDGRAIDLISIGVVAEDGREFYRQNANADLRRANVWVRENVLPKLSPCPVGLGPTQHRGSGCSKAECPWRPAYIITIELIKFVGSVEIKPEFWGYYADYDWVVLCQLFGRMIDLPSGWPMYCRDIKQWADAFFPGVRLDQVVPEKGKHNALSDARWNRAVFDWMVSQEEVMQALYARQGNEQTLSARQVNQESGNVRGAEAGGQDKIGGGDQQRGVEQVRKTRKAQKVS